ncbi:MAG: hypothetical protein ACKOBH_07440 [bacterium]
MKPLISSRSRRKTASAVVAISIVSTCAIAVTGCARSSDPEIAPLACLSGTEAYLTALEGAPGRVEMDDGARISECLPAQQPGGEMATVGSDLVAAATILNADALEDPAGPWSLRAGYLLGAVERAAESTNGIHSDLVRRVNTAARYVPPGDDPEVLMPGFKRGLEAGKVRG